MEFIFNFKGLYIMLVQLKNSDFGLKNFIIKTYDVAFQTNKIGTCTKQNLAADFFDKVKNEFHT
ncbi:hypothetical protein DQM68_17285 [Leptospira mayottensis]|uniref:Uncharacterized protein n=1 Tax=Leptospira mayottensis TaxID=1137606 RepID=A0ABM6Y840_9LEPT|nr:hypothetical protein DQM68_17285 [Leptospira mayottensis]AXR63027.1 hypothetical protein DQM28_00925 [Leptospira mayottensis]AXR66774.1 hypothetical protein DPV73_00750 [Leptospira mayottensis]AZQ01398.1 hypothetical protein LEP1GSC190_04415 [Leptospira mayottensis 200901116]